MFSILCVYNDRAVLEELLLKSLAAQSARHELTLVDNTSGRHRSAAAVFNVAARATGGKYLLFVHQDVSLEGADWLESTERLLDQQENLGVAGVAGATQAGVCSSVQQGPRREHCGSSVTEPTPVQTVDGCLVIVPRRVFDGLPFDEATVKGWYLYAADYSLSAARQGYRVVVIPRPIYHLSEGRRPPRYYLTVRKLVHKHRRSVSRIYTTMDHWRTDLLGFYREWVTSICETYSRNRRMRRRLRQGRRS